LRRAWLTECHSQQGRVIQKIEQAVCGEAIGVFPQARRQHGKGKIEAQIIPPLIEITCPEMCAVLFKLEVFQ